MINAKIRQPNHELNAERRRGFIPAIVYGHGVQSEAISITRLEFVNEIKRLGEGTLLDLQIDKNSAFKVLVQKIQKHPMSEALLHIDFYRVKMDEKLTTQVALNYIGESPAVKFGGILIKNRDHLEIECLPDNLISHLDIDLSKLINVHDTIKVSDLPVPAGVDILEPADLIIVNVAEALELEVDAPTKEAEAAAIEALAKTEDKPAEKDSDAKK